MRVLSRLSCLCAALVSFVLPGVQSAYAQGVPGAVYTVVIPAGEFGSPAYTSVVVNGIAAARKFCGDLGDEAYVVDCLAERLGVIAQEIPADSDYTDVQVALKATSDKLAELARQNRDSDLPRARAARQGSAAPERTTRPLTPVSRASTAQVNQQAIAILDETETLLLRSAESSSEKLAQYSRIAEAVGSNKVLLRAA